MTIAISIEVNDGIVLAADSASTIMRQGPKGNSGVISVYNNPIIYLTYIKVFLLSR
jgi:20S proteasome alpha/beta subunit